MTHQHRTRFIVHTGTTSLAILLALGAPAASAAPSPSNTVTGSASATPSASVTATEHSSESASPETESSMSSSATTSSAPQGTKTSTAEPTSTLERALKSPIHSSAAAQSSSPTPTPTVSASASVSATPNASSQPTNSPKPTSTASQSATSTASASTSATPTPSANAASIFALQGATAVRPGESWSASIANIADQQQVAVQLIAADGSKNSTIDCAVENQPHTATVSCKVPASQKAGKYTVQITTLDQQGQPVVKDGKELIDSTHSVYIADVDQNYNPQVLAQYPVTAAGYVMPIAGGGYEPNSRITLRATSPTGEQLAGITFTPWVDNGVPSVEDLNHAKDTLTVTTDDQGTFKAYVLTNPYMSSSSVKIIAEDTKNNISAIDTLGVLGESVAELFTSVDSIVAGENQTLTVTGKKFAPSYANYPVALQLVRDGQVVTEQSIELSKPTGQDLWSSFDGVTLSDTQKLEAGEYSLQAVVPEDPSIPQEFRGRLLARKTFTVTAPNAQPSATAQPTVPVPSPSASTPAEPEPSASVTSAAPEPVASATAKESAQPAQTTVPEPQQSAEASEPVATAEATPTAQQPQPTASASEPAELKRSQQPIMQTAPLIKQEKKPEATESALDQNPTWIQASSIKAEDPRVEKEINQQLKSSVLSAQGSKNAQGRFDPSNGDTLPGGVNAAHNASAVVNLNKSTPWWPIVLLLVVALMIGAVTGMFISRSAKSQDDES